MGKLSEYLYYFSNDITTINAANRQDHVFIGWYNNYNPTTGTGELISTDQEFNINNVTRDLNLTPVYEPVESSRDYFNVWFDGSNGVGNGTFNGLYTRIQSDGSTWHGSTSVYLKVPKTNSTITLPSTAVSSLSQRMAQRHWILRSRTQWSIRTAIPL